MPNPKAEAGKVGRRVHLGYSRVPIESRSTNVREGGVIAEIEDGCIPIFSTNRQYIAAIRRNKRGNANGLVKSSIWNGCKVFWEGNS